MLFLGLVALVVIPAILSKLYPENTGGGANTRYVGAALSQLVGALALLYHRNNSCFSFNKG